MDALKPIVADVQQSVRSIRRMAQRLRPLQMEGMGIGSAISWICRETANGCSGLRIEQHLVVEESKIPEDRKIVVFRIIEEVLKSIASHGKAGIVEIVLQGIEEHFVLTIRTQFDHNFLEPPVSIGGPFDLVDIPKLKRRVESCGGDFGLEPHPDNTTILVASWPSARDHH
jgi:signal transduction histidine kinase